MRKIIYSIALLGILLFIYCTPEKDALTEFEGIVQQQEGQFDIWIKNGQILNGIDSVVQQADILIKEDSIAYIGTVDSSLFKAEKIIDAKGALITPGFIDTHAHGDPLDTPHFDNFIAMGVTSICLGQVWKSRQCPTFYQDHSFCRSFHFAPA